MHPPWPLQKFDIWYRKARTSDWSRYATRTTLNAARDVTATMRHFEMRIVQYSITEVYNATGTGDKAKE